MTKEEEIKELEQSLASLEEGIRFLQVLIRAEKDTPAINVQDAEQRSRELSGKIRAIDLKIDDLKSDTNKAKESIRLRKSQYEQLPDNLKKDNWNILSEDVSPEHEAIVTNQGLIGMLEKEKFAETQTLEFLQYQLKVAKEGVSALEIEQDPRLKAALADREHIKQQLEKFKNS